MSSVIRQPLFPVRRSLKVTPTEENLRAVRAAFTRSDAEGKGYLTRADVKVAFVGLLGYRPSSHELDVLLEGEETLSSTAFEALALERLAWTDPIDEWRQMFKALDVRGVGYLTIAELRRAFSIVAPRLAGASAEEVFAEADTDGDGRVGFREFERLLRWNLSC
eukprot:TRINITY_DN3974_c0_g1_i4.p3 TRINITY_DN3974_c0_g1~~TRINITY_DN3974_c0_g1_i4.p3  ORF type:complete len:164 (-),score=34.00 TRINITY_DN3974_c0_g1_i4:395-886(-)